MKNEISIYQVDAFTNQLFRGNPAAVCILPEWLSDQILHNIAKENNLPVTAFLVVKNENIIFDGLRRKMNWIFAGMVRSPPDMSFLTSLIKTCKKLACIHALKSYQLSEKII